MLDTYSRVYTGSTVLGSHPFLTALHCSAFGIDLDMWQSWLEIEHYSTTVNNGLIKALGTMCMQV